MDTLAELVRRRRLLDDAKAFALQARLAVQWAGPAKPDDDGHAALLRLMALAERSLHELATAAALAVTNAEGNGNG